MKKHEIHFHTDIELLEGNFVNKFGLPILTESRFTYGYFLQGENIVRIAHSQKDAQDFNRNYKGQLLEPIYFYRKKTEREKQLIENFCKMMEETQKDLDPVYTQFVNDNFHELLS